MRFTISFGIFTIQLLSTYAYSQCTDYTTYGVDAGSLTFNSSSCDYQTIGVDEQDYFTINVVSGNDYHFDFCGNGGSPGSLYPNMSLMNGATLITSDLWDGTCASISWTATFTGTIYLYITDDWDGCASGAGSWSGTMAYNEDDGSGNASFTMASTSCSSAEATITGETGGAFSFNPAPGDGASINASTGQITNGVAGSTYNVDYTVCGITTNESITLSTSGNAAFSLNPSCGGAVPIISGDQGGTFSFNTAPGDGAQISASSGVISNGTAGSTYYVDYTVCGSTATQSVTVLDDNCFTLVGSSDAQYITVNGEQCIQLTAAANDETGCAWNGNQINFNNDFSLNLDYYFGSNANGADGTTFTFHSASPSSCGEPGAMLGAGGSGVSDALIIEFDTYDNDGGTNNDLSADHIAVEIDEILIDDPTSGYTNLAPLCGPEEAIAGGANITDGLMHNVEISWDATNQLLNIYFDGDLRLTCNNDFVANAFGGNNIVYWGATAATGGLNNQQYFCPSTVVILPVELSEFYSNCEEDQEVFHWISESEKDLDFYELEYTYDGLVFYSEVKVDAVGTTDTKTNYSVHVSTDDELKRYYRLKLTDIDGRTETTDLITSKNCNSTIQNLIGSISQTGSTVDVSLTTSGSIIVIDQMGKILMESEIPGSHFTIKIDHLDAGVYSIIALNAGQTLKETKRFVKGF